MSWLILVMVAVVIGLVIPTLCLLRINNKLGLTNLRLWVIKVTGLTFLCVSILSAEIVAVIDPSIIHAPFGSAQFFVNLVVAFQLSGPMLDCKCCCREKGGDAAANVRRNFPVPPAFVPGLSRVTEVSSHAENPSTTTGSIFTGFKRAMSDPQLVSGTKSQWNQQAAAMGLMEVHREENEHGALVAEAAHEEKTESVSFWL